jgi:hypothetical protein
MAKQAAMFPVSPGPSIREMIQEDLDAAVDELKSIPDSMDGCPAQAESRGVCYGLARALAIMTNPYDFEQALVVIRADAMERWEIREHGDFGVSVAGSREV